MASIMIELLPIKDHNRMKIGAVTSYDRTHEQQRRRLPLAHPEDWDAASDQFEHGGYWGPNDT